MAVFTGSQAKTGTTTHLFTAEINCKDESIIMTGHHLILGKIRDVITGEVLQETHDERFRQEIARLLLKKGYEKKEIVPRRKLLVTACDKSAEIHIDFLVRLGGVNAMLIRFGPGSLVTRHRPGLAVSRVLEPYQIPVVVVTNGIEADILNGISGKIAGKGLEGIPNREELLKLLADAPLQPLPEGRVEKEMRIVYAYEVDDACPCDDSICRLS